MIEGEPRTIGNLEAWHRRFGIIVNKSHPSIWQLLRELQNEQIHTEATIGKLIAGHILTKPRKDQEIKNARLSNVVGNYEEMKENGNMIDYLRACTYNFDY